MQPVFVAALAAYNHHPAGGICPAFADAASYLDRHCHNPPRLAWFWQPIMLVLNGDFGRALVAAPPILARVVIWPA